MRLAALEQSMGLGGVGHGEQALLPELEVASGKEPCMV